MRYEQQCQIEGTVLLKKDSKSGFKIAVSVVENYKASQAKNYIYGQEDPRVRFLHQCANRKGKIKQ
jgi:hypothetical protein